MHVARWTLAMTVAASTAFACGCASGDKSRSNAAPSSASATGDTATERVAANRQPRRMVEPQDPQTTPEQSYVRGVEFLIANQNEDGSWGSFASARPMQVYLDNLSSL